MGGIEITRGRGVTSHRAGQPSEQTGNPAPALPAVKSAQIVGAHDPGKMHPRAGPDQITYGLIGVPRAELRFEVGDVDTRVVSKRARGPGAGGQ